MRFLAVYLFVVGAATWLIGANVTMIGASKRLGVGRKSLGMWQPNWVPWKKLNGKERLKIILFAFIFFSSFAFMKLVYAP